MCTIIVHLVRSRCYPNRTLFFTSAIEIVVYRTELAPDLEVHSLWVLPWRVIFSLVVLLRVAQSVARSALFPLVLFFSLARSALFPLLLLFSVARSALFYDSATAERYSEGSRFKRRVCVPRGFASCCAVGRTGPPLFPCCCDFPLHKALLYVSPTAERYSGGRGLRETDVCQAY